MAVRLSTLAEIKAFSVATLARGANTDGEELANILLAIDSFKSGISNANEVFERSDDLFRTVGLARSIRISEDFGTQNYYGIGSPTRPRIVPNNYSVTANVERIQLDTRNLGAYFASPEYWYSNQVQNQIGVDDYKLYSYFFVKSKEDSEEHDVYALMPRSSQTAITSNNVMIANTVDMVGFKSNYSDLLSILEEEITEALSGSFPPSDSETVQFGANTQGGPTE